MAIDDARRLRYFGSTNLVQRDTKDYTKSGVKHLQRKRVLREKSSQDLAAPLARCDTRLTICQIPLSILQKQLFGFATTRRGLSIGELPNPKFD